VLDSKGRTIWIAEAHRGDRKRFIVRADEKLTAFLELESAIRACGDCIDKPARFFPNFGVVKRYESGGGLFPARFLCLARPAIAEQHGGETERNVPMNPLIN